MVKILFLIAVVAISVYMIYTMYFCEHDLNRRYMDDIRTKITTFADQPVIERTEHLRKHVKDTRIISAKSLSLLSYAEIDSFLASERGRILWLYADGEYMFFPYDHNTPEFVDQSVDDMVEGLKTPESIRDSGRLKPWFKLNMFYNAVIARAGEYKIVVVHDTSLIDKMFPEFDKYLMSNAKENIMYESSYGELLGIGLIPFMEKYGGVAMPCTATMTRSLDTVIEMTCKCKIKKSRKQIERRGKRHGKRHGKRRSKRHGKRHGKRRNDDDSYVESDSSDDESGDESVDESDSDDCDDECDDNHVVGPCRCFTGAAGSGAGLTKPFFSRLSARAVRGIYSNCSSVGADVLKYPAPVVFGRRQTAAITEGTVSSICATPIYDKLIANLKHRSNGRLLRDPRATTATDLADEGQLALRAWHEFVLGDLDTNSISVMDMYHTFNTPAPGHITAGGNGAGNVGNDDLEFRNHEYFEPAVANMKKVITHAIDEGFVPFFCLPYNRIIRESPALDNDVLTMDLRPMVYNDAVVVRYTENGDDHCDDDQTTTVARVKHRFLLPDAQISDKSVVNIFYEILALKLIKQGLF